MAKELDEKQKKFLEQVDKAVKAIGDDFENGKMDNYLFVTGDYREGEALRERYGVKTCGDWLMKYGEIRLCVTIKIENEDNVTESDT